MEALFRSKMFLYNCCSCFCAETMGASIQRHLSPILPWSSTLSRRWVVHGVPHSTEYCTLLPEIMPRYRWPLSPTALPFSNHKDMLRSAPTGSLCTSACLFPSPRPNILLQQRHRHHGFYKWCVLFIAPK